MEKDCNPHRHNARRTLRGVVLKVDHRVLRVAAAPLPLHERVWALHKHGRDGADAALTRLGRVPSDLPVDAREAVLLDRLGQLVLPHPRGCVGARRVGRRVHRVQRQTLHQRKRLFKLFLLPAREGHNGDGGYEGVWHTLSDEPHDPLVPFEGVIMADAAEDGVVARWEGQVEVVGKRRQRRDVADEALGLVARVGDGEAVAEYAGHVQNGLKERR